MEVQGSRPIYEPLLDCVDAYTGRYNHMAVLYSALHVKKLRKTSPPTA